ncbi:MAG: hypothetical protein PHO27_10555 [Sulfuricurvum sp.]|nr:hypothetical protein [Sulfuricurvum sp.]
MKRCEFLTVATGAVGLALMPKITLAEKSISDPKLVSKDFSKHPYYDNKVVRVYDNKVSNYDFTDGSIF